MKRSPHLRALALIAPLLFFLGLFFVWPLVTVISQAVSDPAVSQVLARTASEIGDWDGEGLPSPEIHAAFPKRCGTVPAKRQGRKLPARSR